MNPFARRLTMQRFLYAAACVLIAALPARAQSGHTSTGIPPSAGHRTGASDSAVTRAKTGHATTNHANATQPSVNPQNTNHPNVSQPNANHANGNHPAASHPTANHPSADRATHPAKTTSADQHGKHKP